MLPFAQVDTRTITSSAIKEFADDDDMSSNSDSESPFPAARHFALLQGQVFHSATMSYSITESEPIGEGTRGVVVACRCAFMSGRHTIPCFAAADVL